MIDRLNSSYMLPPSYSFQFVQIFLALSFAIVAIVMALNYKVKSDNDVLPLDLIILSRVFLTSAFTTGMAVFSQFAMRGAYWYGCEYLDHVNTNYYSKITSLIDGEASLSHIDTEKGVLIDINGPRSLSLDFHHRGSDRSSAIQGFELLIEDTIDEKGWLYVDGTSVEPSEI